MSSYFENTLTGAVLLHQNDEECSVFEAKNEKQDNENSVFIEWKDDVKVFGPTPEAAQGHK